MASTSISDFKITVKLDSSKAMAGLRSLHAKMNAFANSTRGSLAVQTKVNEKIKEKVSLFKRLIRMASIFVRSTFRIGRGFGKVGKTLSKAVLKPISSITGMLGDWKWMILAAAGSFVLLTSKITRTGMAVQRATIAMQAAVSGSTIAEGMSPKTLARLQRNQLNFAIKLAKAYGLGLTDTVNEYAKFFAAASHHIGVTSTEHVFKGFAKLSTVYGLSAEKQQRAMVALTQMASKNQVMSEELKQQLAEVLPGSLEIFKKAITKTGKHGEVTMNKLYKLMEQGKVVASEVLPVVAEFMEAAADPALAEALDTAAVQFSRLQTQMEVTQGGIFNQFEEPLTELIRLITTFLGGEGMQFTIGETIASTIEKINKVLSPFFKDMEEFEKKWQEADIDAKAKMTVEGTFYKSVYNSLITTIEQAWRDTDLTFFRDKLLSTFQYVWDNLRLVGSPLSFLTGIGSKAGISLAELEIARRFEGIEKTRTGGRTTQDVVNRIMEINMSFNGPVNESSIPDLTQNFERVVNPYLPNH
jgi:tape measure domain-containing protein